MDKFNFEFFEFAGATIPGIPIFILTCFLISSTPFSFEQIIFTLKNISITETSFAILSSYCIGFCFHYPAYGTFQWITKLLRKKSTKNYPISLGKREKELVIIRHNSPDNFKIINKFLALRQMSYSMFFSLIICSSSLFINLFTTNLKIDNSFKGFLLALILSLLFLKRAIAFHQRIQEMITESSKLSISPKLPAS